MKNTLLLICAFMAGLTFSGCVTEKNDFPIATVGPGPSQYRTASSTTGTLVVYSAFKRNADFNTSDPNRPEHSDYKIFNTDGSLLCKVHNVTTTVFEDAVPIDLPPGRYTVGARANEYGYLKIPVMVVAQQRTVVHLEGGGFWPSDSTFDASNSVSLPDGQIIGWKSAEQ